MLPFKPHISFLPPPSFQNPPHKALIIPSRPTPKVANHRFATAPPLSKEGFGEECKYDRQSRLFKANPGSAIYTKKAEP